MHFLAPTPLPYTSINSRTLVYIPPGFLETHLMFRNTRGVSLTGERLLYIVPGGWIYTNQQPVGRYRTSLMHLVP
jgi:hypothetical protein